MSNKIDLFGRTDIERASLREKAEAMNAEAIERWSDAKFRSEVAAEITEAVFEGFQHENLLPLMATVRNLGFNDRMIEKETTGLRAFWVARGGYIEESTLRSETFEVPRDTIGFHVKEHEDKILSGFVETQSSIIQLGIERMDASVNSRFIATLEAATPTGGTNHVTGAGISLAALNAAIRTVREESKTGEVAIIGRATTTEAVMDTLLGTDLNGSGFLAQSNEEMVRRGVLGTYRGANLITLQNYRDEADQPYINAADLYVIAKDAATVGLFGGLKSREGLEHASWYWSYVARRDVGFLVRKPELVVRITDTNQV